MGDALPLWPWPPLPGTPPAPRDGLLVLAVRPPAGASRAQARLLLRAAVGALPEQLTQLPQLPQLAGRHYELITTPGQAPLLRAGDGAVIGCSFSHAEGLSLAALNLNGPVGIDCMEENPIEDWAALARDYLGPQVAAQLAACAPQRRAAALARAWTAREASLKCLGLALAEWRPLPACRLLPLQLPAGWHGTLALPG